jgi:hypothetical protein
MTTKKDVVKAIKIARKRKKQIPLILKYESSDDCFANRKHPYWKNKKGNPYLPLNEDGSLKQAIIG